MSPLSQLARLPAGSALERTMVPDLSWPDFVRALLDGTARGLRVVAYFGARDGAGMRLYQVLADDERSEVALGTTRLSTNGFPSLTPQRSQLHLFEREIAEQLGLQPAGHPWLTSTSPPCSRPRP